MHVCTDKHMQKFMSCVLYMFHTHTTVNLMLTCNIHSYIQTDKQMDRHSYLYTDGKNLIRLFILILIRYAVILKCWKTDVDERLSFKDILEELNSLSNYL